jgi:thiol-disulfide isomerase/thioredoxin
MRKGAKTMKKILMSLTILSILCLGLMTSASSNSPPPLKDEVLQKIILPVPKNPDEKTYLGLSGTGTFKIPQIKAKVVLIEIFSMYCPYCQGDAPKINELYQRIENDPDLNTKIKMIGIGAGNSPFEVEVFKKTYKVPFPLFSDKDFVIHKACGEPRTPYFIIVKINDDRSYQIVHSQLGGFPGAEPFLELILKASGLK